MPENHWPRLDLRAIEFGPAASVFAAHGEVGATFVNFHPRLHAALAFFGGPSASLEVELTHEEHERLLDFLGTFWTEVSTRWMKEKLGAE